MPLNRPALSLGAGPRGVQDARRWVVDACVDMGRPELVESAELGVSELVTNALLHGAAPIEVRVRGTIDHPRVEVRDSSRERPMLPSEVIDDDEDVLLTFGRGLSIVARCSDAWGAEIEEDGKVVWFAPAAEVAEEGVVGVITGIDAEQPEPLIDPLTVHVHGAPVAQYLAFERHFRELRREVRLLAFAHQDDYPLAKDLSDLFGRLELQLRDGLGRRQVDEAVAQGAELVDLELVVPREVTPVMARFIELLDLADEFCRQQRLLSLARTVEQRTFQLWYIGEFLRQARGEAPMPWPHEITSHQRSSVS
ncbi:MAG: ATP-binding protein [Actinobacteria bacterium]|uniref:Unannotated protein n=1 Tax=freshwater metagenome TaxID=449393 RepID=A0A6J6QSX8_9ZZZZ|nr:ATP-binding protein [Actinomycetota bacterium]